MVHCIRRKPRALGNQSSEVRDDGSHLQGDGGKDIVEGETAFEILDEYTVSIAYGLCSKGCVKAEVAAIKADAAKYLFQITF
ncbi:MAG: hypothetical protein SF339_18280 [Blastocatellia bacterium]|nr:hypothetical protein [Blastocatellia bacterium]